ncbi:hypothetical protein [Rouxiella sp. Mn2063]|uniref:hypothetical protein n=1 Tax=Rouxiella sp. Mn2063 TaxID=3395262 RepID=UPI003BDFADF9
MYFRKKRLMERIFTKNNGFVVVCFAFLAAYIAYLGWSSSISHRVVFFRSFPAFAWTLTVSLIGGLFFAWRGFYYRPVGKTAKHIFEMFFGGCALLFVLTMNMFDVYVYLFPKEVTSYVTDYDISFPGPSRGKNGRCEAGLWIKERHTSRWIQLCSSKAELAVGEHHKQGMDGVLVTAKINSIGTYIINYEFTYK